MLASLDGAIAPVGQTVVPVDDEGLLRGDGVFEVVRLYGGRPFALDEHLERMRGSAERARLDLDLDALRSDVDALLAEAAPGDALLRLVWTRGGRRLAILEALPALPERVALVTIPYAPTRVLDGVKSLSYCANMLCTRLAKERGADDALLVTPHGRVLEAPTSSFFYVVDGALVTPPLEDHILDSITRRRVLAVADAQERPTTLDDVCRASEAFLASTVREALPVRAVDDVRLDAPGPVTREVAAALAARIAEELAHA